MEKYELTVVLPSKSTPAKVKAFRESLEKQINLLKGSILDVKEWGEIDLAYPIKKNNTGFFMHFILELDRVTAKEIVSKLNLNEKMIRHLLIKGK